ncbi:MAG TPA: PaaI family thioesterase [Bdellovibrionota bacterium]|jgi:acyl-CoA thioesterase|nr:PaaI family thioesterase [Bdellovibrionota bacterium]
MSKKKAAHAKKATSAETSNQAVSRLGLQNYSLPDRFGQWLGYEVVEVDRKGRRARTRLQIRGEHLSAAGRVHGGVVSAFLDFSCGGAVFSTMGPQDFCSTVELKVNYLRPLMNGDLLTAETEVVFRGKKLCVVRGLAWRGNDVENPVAMATATFNVVTPKE